MRNFCRYCILEAKVYLNLLSRSVNFLGQKKVEIIILVNSQLILRSLRKKNVENTRTFSPLFLVHNLKSKIQIQSRRYKQHGDFVFTCHFETSGLININQPLMIRASTFDLLYSSCQKINWNIYRHCILRILQENVRDISHPLESHNQNKNMQ